MNTNATGTMKSPANLIIYFNCEITAWLRIQLELMMAYTFVFFFIKYHNTDTTRQIISIKTLKYKTDIFTGIIIGLSENY